jgi:peptidoglycan/xylan/chitin deacetylase (PgdA/CDA1 family)
VNPWLISVPGVALTAAGIASYGAIHSRTQLFGETIFRTDAPHKLAITFDDGPNPAITPRLLDLLSRFSVPATFFLIGKYARQAPELVREIHGSGHVIGNHTDTHPNLFFCSPAQIREQLLACSNSLASILGAAPLWVRPPWGVRNPWLAPIARELKLKVVMWTLLPGDWRAPNDEWLIRRLQPVSTRASSPERTGDVICLHDGSHAAQNADRLHTLAALEYWLPRWRDLGLEFVTIPDAVHRPAD